MVKYKSKIERNFKQQIFDLLTSNNLLDKIRISDHFIGSLGTISFNEAVRKDFIKNSFANMIFQRKILCQFISILMC